MAEGDLSRRPARDASAQAIVDALNQVNRNVAAARDGIRRVEEKQLRTGGGAVGAPLGRTGASNSELERRVQLFREGRIEAEATARTEFDHLQQLKRQADEARRVAEAQRTIVPQQGYRPGGGRASYFAEQQAAAEARSTAFQRQLGLVPPAQTGSLVVVENEINLRKRALEQVRLQEERIAAERLANEKLIAQERIRSEAQQALGQGPLYYGQRTGHPGTQYTSLRAGRAAEGVPERSSVQRFQRDTFNSLDASQAVSANPGRLRQFYAEMQQGAIIQANASQQMRRHGALTTEFLQALARGEVTLSEFRYQLGSTIGKFAGWTAAATSVYGVVGAISVLGRGAVDSLSGVNQLGRFVTNLDTQEAQAQFRGLAREFNLPVQTVVDGASRIAQVYHDQTDALQATRTVLTAVRVADLDVADATGKMIPIVQGFKLNVSDLANVLGAANQAQNDFGASIPDLLSGLAKAGGAVRAAGGDYLTAISFITTAKRVTGQSGDAIGTALRRSAQLIRRPSNREVLARYGIDPDADYNTILRESLRIGDRLQKQGLTGRRQLAELATQGLSTPQLGPIFTAVLQNRDLFNSVYGDVQPVRSQIGLNRELRFVLSSIGDQFRSIRSETEAIGSSLAEAHVFDIFGGLLKTLQLTLSTVNNLLDVFNRLPDPIKRSVVYLGEAYLALRLLRRTGVGTGLAERTGVGFLGPSQGDVLRRQAISSQRRLSESLANEQERVANAAAGKYAGVYTGEARIALLGERRAALLATEGANQLKIQTIETEINAERRRINTLRAEAMLLAEQEAIINARRMEVEGTVVGLQKRRLTVEQAAAVRGAPIVVPTGPGSTQTISPAAGAAAGEAAAVRNQLGARAARVRNTLDSLILTNAVASRNAVSVAEGGRGLGRSYAAFERAALVGSAITARGVQVAETALGGIRGAAAGIRAAGAGLLAALGPLDIALIGSIVGFEAIHSAQEEQRKRTEAMRKIFADPKTAQQAEQIRRSAEKLSNPTRGGISGYYDAVARTVTDILPGDQDTKGKQVEREAEKAQRRAEQLLAERQRVLRRQQSGGVAPNAFLSQVEQQFKADVRKYKDYNNLRDAVDRRIEEVLQSVEARRNPSDPRISAQIARYRNFIASRVPEGADPFAEFEGVTREFLGRLMERAAARIQVRAQAGGSRTGPLRELAAGYITAVQRYSGGSLDDLKAVSDARDAFLRGISQPIDEELQTALKLAHSPAQTQQAYDRAVTRYRDALSQLRNTRATQRTGLADAEQQLRQYEKDLSEAQQERAGIRLAPNEPRSSGAKVDAIADQIRQQRQTIKRLSSQLGGSSTAVRRAERELQALLQDQETAAFQARDQSRQTQLAYQQSKTSDKSVQIQEAIRTQGQAVRDAIRSFGRSDNRTIEAITKQNELMKEAADQAIEHVKTLGDLRTSRIGSLGTTGDLDRARSDIQTIREQIAAARRGKADPDKIRQLMTELNNAQRGLAQTLKEQADALAQARFDLAIAGIIEPAERLARQLAFDRRRLRGLSGIERIQQLAKVRQDRSDLQQQNLNDDLEQLNFLHNIEKLSDEQYIAELRKIINTRKLSKSLRRQLLEEIHNLQKQDQSEIELNVGDIRLPTLYDVRRLQKLGTNQQMTVHQSFSFQIDGSGDPEATASSVADKFESTSRSSLKAQMRAAGLTG